MNMKNDKVIGFDLIRAFAVFFIFFAHIINKQSHNETILLIWRSISPGLTMSLLGFISAYLLTTKYNSFDGEFFIKRFSRIYSSLIICLFAITILHLILSYDVVNQHSILHFMGLSFFMELFKVSNKSSLGAGLWFITIINIMYLLLPLISTIYKHKHSKIHLLLIVVLCLCLDKMMYGTSSAWNVVIAFNIGCYIGLNLKIETLSKKPLILYLIASLILLLICGLATSRIVPYEIRGFLFPFYPFIVAPLIYKIGNSMIGLAQQLVSWFSSISYEVYIIHFYFINKYFSDLFPSIKSIFLQISIAFLIVLPLAFIFSRTGSWLSRITNKYLISK